MNGKAQEAPGSPPPIVLHPEVGLLNKIMVRAYMIFVADVVDIVRRANIFMWSNFAPHENLSVLCGRNLLSMKSNFAPYASLDQQTWTRSGLTISPTNDDSCIKSWNGGTLLQVFTKFGLVVPLTYLQKSPLRKPTRKTSKPNLRKYNQPSRWLGSLLGSTSSWTTDEISLGSSIKAPTLSPALGAVPSY